MNTNGHELGTESLAEALRAQRGRDLRGHVNSRRMLRKVISEPSASNGDMTDGEES